MSVENFSNRSGKNLSNFSRSFSNLSGRSQGNKSRRSHGHRSGVSSGRDSIIRFLRRLSPGTRIRIQFDDRPTIRVFFEGFDTEGNVLVRRDGFLFRILPRQTSLPVKMSNLAAGLYLWFRPETSPSFFPRQEGLDEAVKSYQRNGPKTPNGGARGAPLCTTIFPIPPIPSGSRVARRWPTSPARRLLRPIPRTA
jgi:hypothetical protein